MTLTDADKNLKDLFYEKTADNIDFMEYTNSITKFIIRFWKSRRTIYIMDEINMTLLKAINKKAKELEWIHEKKKIQKNKKIVATIK